MADWLSPHVQWPSHPRGGDTQRAFEAVRRAGWWFKPSGGSGHLFGTLTCKRPSGERRLGEDNCAQRVFGTARGDDTAKVITRSIEKCPHRNQAAKEGEDRSPDASAGRVAEAHAHMDRADRLLDAADRLRDDSMRRDRRDELLEEAITAKAEAEQALLAAADLEEEAATRMRQEARGLADHANLGHDPWPPPEGVHERLIAPAGVYTERARSLLHGYEGSGVGSARDRLDDLTRRLEGWRPGSS